MPLTSCHWGYGVFYATPPFLCHLYNAPRCLLPRRTVERSCFPPRRELITASRWKRKSRLCDSLPSTLMFSRPTLYQKLRMRRTQTQRETQTQTQTQVLLHPDLLPDPAPQMKIWKQATSMTKVSAVGRTQTMLKQAHVSPHKGENENTSGAKGRCWLRGSETA